MCSMYHYCSTIVLSSRFINYCVICSTLFTHHYVVWFSRHTRLGCEFKLHNHGKICNLKTQPSYSISIHWCIGGSMCRIGGIVYPMFRHQCSCSILRHCCVVLCIPDSDTVVLGVKCSGTKVFKDNILLCCVSMSRHWGVRCDYTIILFVQCACTMVLCVQCSNTSGRVQYSYTIALWIRCS